MAKFGNFGESRLGAPQSRAPRCIIAELGRGVDSRES